MAEEQFQERTEEPTPKRLKESKEKGQVVRSRELTTMAVTLGGAVALFALGVPVVAGIAENMSEHLHLTKEQAVETDQMLEFFKASSLSTVQMLLPWLAVLTGVAALAPLALGGWSFSPQALAFKGERISPAKGLKRVFAMRGLMELLKAVAKFLVVGAVAILVLFWEFGEFMSLGRQPVKEALAHSGWLIAISFLLFSAALILIAAVDIPFQIWDHKKKLRMTKQEVKDDLKETEGKPEVRSRIRSTQQALARRRMLEDIPIASVVVTNPTHYAVALRYEPDEMNAPVVVAKGADHMAALIRERAAEFNVPIFQAPPLARALFDTVDIGDEIDERLYVSVAQVLTYIYQLDAYLAHGGVEPQRPEIDL